MQSLPANTSNGMKYENPNLCWKTLGNDVRLKKKNKFVSGRWPENLNAKCGFFFLFFFFFFGEVLR